MSRQLKHGYQYRVRVALRDDKSRGIYSLKIAAISPNQVKNIIDSLASSSGYEYKILSIRKLKEAILYI